MVEGILGSLGSHFMTTSLQIVSVLIPAPLAFVLQCKTGHKVAATS